jgi:UDP-glucose 4-epimerase
MLFVWHNAHATLNVFNVGVESSTKVTRIAELVVEEMKLNNVSFTYTGGDRGWIGDVPKFSYQLDKIHALGWRAKASSDEAIRLAIRAELRRRDPSRRSLHSLLRTNGSGPQ